MLNFIILNREMRASTYWLKSSLASVAWTHALSFAHLGNSAHKLKL